MKKLIALIMAVLFLLAGCGGLADDTTALKAEGVDAYVIGEVAAGDTKIELR